MKVLTFDGQTTPHYLASGYCTRFIEPVALEVCKGVGLDIGCNRVEWTLSGAVPIDPVIDSRYHANSLPARANGWDYIFSSHCLEHITDYVTTLEYWTKQIKVGGVLFLYLPHPDCRYWLPWKMPTRKHVHQFYPSQMIDIFNTLGYTNVFCSERDLAYSFAIFGEKSE